MSNRLIMPQPHLPLPPRESGTTAVRMRKREAFDVLDRVGQELEPTATQMERAETSYTTIGEWLADDPLLAEALIYAQGSIAHGTANKPIGSNEHDVDLICHVPGYSPALPPATLKKIVGDRLASNDRYRPMLEEMPRCWRINYAGEFHLDITPSIINPGCPNGGELVPDRKLKDWKPSNPKGFRDLFARRASLVPAMKALALEGGRIAMDKADVEPFPAKWARKGVLRRTVQLLKRHRDIAFLKQDMALLPLSIIITTLASQAYEWCVTHHTYDNELDLLCDTIRAMPWFIEDTVVGGAKHWLIWNETTSGENFAERWNADRRRAQSFFAWHGRALADFEAVAERVGLDEVVTHLSGILGDNPVRGAMDSISSEISAARKTSRLHVTPGIGLTAGIAAGTPVRANTFFGR
jgi:hypothetical protein